MTKLSQCAKCDHDRRLCGHYVEEDDRNCPHYVHEGKPEPDETQTQRGKALILAVFYPLIAIYVYLRWFDSMWVFIILAIPLIVLAIWAVLTWRKAREKQKQERMRQEKEKEQLDFGLKPGMTTRNLLQIALRQLGIEYNFDEDNAFHVVYQGENLRIIASDDSRLIDIYDVWWYMAPLDDIDNLSLMHRAINDCNIRGKAKLVYTYNEEEGVIGVHTQLHLLWTEGIPDLARYLKTSLDLMLFSHQCFYQVMEQLRREENTPRR